MIDALPLLLGPEGYQISRSVRLRSSASAYFSRTYGTPTSRRIFTFSFWIKRGILGATQRLVSQAAGAGLANDAITFTSANAIDFLWNGQGAGGSVTTNALFRDPSAYMPLVIAVDTTQATASNRIKIYLPALDAINPQTLSGTYPTLNYDTYLNSAAVIELGRLNATTYFDGYLTEINFIDGQALTPASFGETDVLTGVWKPKKYAGTYGTNGFYLNFSDNSAATAAAIGKDNSGNGNNWTPNNITLSPTTSVSYDSMLDVPTQWADGGNGRGNYAVANPINAASGLTISDGNLKLAASAAGSKFVNASLALPSSGAFYAEITFANASSNVIGQSIGIQSASRSLTGAWNATGSYTFYGTNAAVLAANGTTTASGLSAISANEVFQVAVDVTNSKMWIGRSNVWYNSTGGTTGDPATGANPTFTGSFADFFFYAGYDTTSAISANFNFGQRPFAYTPPTGFKALNTLNLPTPTILKGNQYFDATTYTGNGTLVSVINSGGFQPDLVWLKQRSGANQHNLMDTARGAGFRLRSDGTNADEVTPGTFTFDVSGFTANTTNVSYNASGGTYVGWQWKEGATQGFDIVTYTGTATNRTIAHNLGVAPKMMLVKNRTDGSTSWRVWHSALAGTEFLELNTTAAKATGATQWNSTVPTSANFSLGIATATNGSGDSFVNYLFAEVAGFSKFGSYTGNGSADGPFIFTGFRPRWIMVKSSSASGSWNLIDTARDTYNLSTGGLYADLTDAQDATRAFDILSNGFKMRSATVTNASATTYIYAAFAENPFKNALAR